MAEPGTTYAVVRELREADLDVVAEMARTSFDASLRPYLVPAQEGWSRFLALVLAQPASFPSYKPAVVEQDGRVVGFADYREVDGDGFLSYICVAPEARGQGLSRRLLVELATRHGHREVALDVFEDNEVARALYDSMGFVETGRQTWWRDSLPLPTQPLALTGLPAAAASLSAYGFCDLTGEREGRPFRYGRTGRQVLRAYAARDFDDDETVAALAATFSELEERFVSLPDGVRPASPTATPFLTSLRMVASPFEPPTEPR